MVTKKSSVISHTKFSFITGYFHESTISSWSKGYNFPWLFLVSANNISFFVIEEFFSKRMKNKITLLIFMMRLTGFRVRFHLTICILNFNKFPDVIFNYMVGIRWTAWNFVKFRQVRITNLMCVNKIFCLEITQSHSVIQIM